MIGRLGRYVLTSYPPVLSVLFALGWVYGVTGLFAAVDPGSQPWRPGWGTAVAALTVSLNLLLMRTIDDIRDLDYDRVHSPGRPLPSGAVTSTDLLTLYAAGAVAILAINLGRGWALALIAVQLGYAVLVLGTYRRLRWPDGDNMWLTLLISCPAQILLHLYLYALYLRTAGHGADGSVWWALAVLVCASMHLELGKKIVRRPKPGERTYVTTIGLRSTVVLAVIAPVASVAVLLVAARPLTPWALAVLVPLVLPLLAYLRFRRPDTNRWPARHSAFYLLLTFASFLLPGLAA